MGRATNMPRSGASRQERNHTTESRSVKDDYPEQEAHSRSILEARQATAKMLEYTLSDGWTSGKTGWKILKGDRSQSAGDARWFPGLFDASITSIALSKDELEATLLSYGGRDHSKTIARLMSVGARRSAGIEGSVECPQREIDHRVYSSPRSALSARSTIKSNSQQSKSNPLGQRVGGRLRPARPSSVLKRMKTGSREASGAGETSPLSRMVAMPQSPMSPLRGTSSPFPGLVSTAHKDAPQQDAFLPGKATVLQAARKKERQMALSGLLGAQEHEQAQMGGSIVASNSVRSGSGSSSSIRSPAEMLRNPLSPLLAARALTSPHLLPITGRGGQRASAHKIMPTGTMHATWSKDEEEQQDPNVLAGAQKKGWHQQVMRLRSVVADGKVANWKMSSPLTDLERTILSESKWRQRGVEIDHHDKVVLAGLPYNASKAIQNPGILRSLGRAVLHEDPLVRTAGLAALGDKSNFGNPSCLAQVVPRLADPDTRVKAAALRGIEQIAKPGEQKQYMEVEIEVFGADNLPKKDRFGACDGYVILTLKHPGEPDTEVGRTEIKWKDLNPRWRQNFYIEIKEPAVDVIEFSVWDEDGETDDICGVCSLPVKDIEFDEDSGAKPQLSRSLQILDQNTEEPIRGWNAVGLQNNGELSFLRIRARYTAYLRPKDLINQFIELLDDDHTPTRKAALSTVSTFYVDGNDIILDAVANMLEDADESIRWQASSLLEELAGVNDPYVIEIVARRMDHCDPKIRHTAVETLTKIANKGNAVAIAQVAKRLESSVPVIRSLVSEALPAVADVGDPAALQEITNRFQSKSSDVREAAILAFTVIAPVGDDNMISVIEPMMEDEDQSCRMAAVQALKRVSNVGPLGDQSLLARARAILQKRVDLNNGAGDPNRVILDSVKSALSSLNAKAPRIFACDPANEGNYNSLLPAKWVRITRDQGVFTELVDPMPIDNKFNSSLPYRPPTPPWEPKAMQKAALNKTIAKAKSELAAAQNSILQLEEEAEERDLSTAEEFELEELQKKEAQYLAVLEKAQAELDELVGHVEVQPPNTTKLGFTIQIKHGFGEHCQWHKCKRSACF